MPEDVTVLEDLQIIQVHSYGDVTLDDLEGSLEAIIRIREERGLSRVFVDATEETSLPPAFSAYEFGKQIADFVRGLRVAVVGSKMLAEDMRFIETVAQNREAVLKIFETVEDALTWLMKQPNKSMEATS